MTLVANEHYTRRARELVEGNAERFPELLVSQLATAMQGESEAIASAYRMRQLVAVCMRLVERAAVKPSGDEVIAAKLAEEMSFCMPSRNGGDGWLDEDQLRMELAA